VHQEVDAVDGRDHGGELLLVGAVGGDPAGAELVGGLPQRF
jgi:hypothetical protein